eukprot:g2318.t1
MGGGILSPAMWCVYIDSAPAELRRPTNPSCERECDFFADDGCILVAAPSLELLRLELWGVRADLGRVLEVDEELVLDDGKTRILVLHSSLVASPAVCREKRRHQGPPGARVWNVQAERVEIPPENIGALPFKQVTSHRILGVIVDHMLCFQDHYDYLIEKATRRMPILYSLTNYDWGAEPGVLTQAVRALIVQPTAFAIGAWGSYATDGVLRDLNTKILNVAQRLAIGSDRTMRLEVLRVLAESHSVFNLYGRAAATLIDATLRGPESSLRELLAPLVLRLPCVQALPKTTTEDEWVMLPHTSPLPPAARCASALAGRVETGIEIFYVPATQTDNHPVDDIAQAVRAGNLRPAFHSYAEELDDKYRTFDPGWIRNATEILLRTGWTPEHATAFRTLRMLKASNVFFHLDCDDVRKLEQKISDHIAAGFPVGASDGSVKHDTEVGTAANLLYCSAFKYGRPHLRGYRRRGAVAAYGMEHLGLDRLLLDLAEGSAPTPAVPLLLVLDCQSLIAFLDRLVGTEVAGADKDVALVRNLERVALKYTQVDVMFSPSHLGVSVNELADAVATHLHTVLTPAETTVPPRMSHEEVKAAVGDIMEKSELDAIYDLVEKKSQVALAKPAGLMELLDTMHAAEEARRTHLQGVDDSAP